jgi:hypothetical protein
MGRNNKDFLEAHGMSKVSQYAATMRAATFDPSDLEGEYQSIGTYNSPSARLLKNITQHRERELKVKKAYGK